MLARLLPVPCPAKLSSFPRSSFVSKAAFSWSDPFRLDDQLTADERQVRDAAHAYCQEKLLPRVQMAFRNEQTDRAIFNEMGELGLLGPTIPEQYGGAGLNYVCYGLVAREVERVDSGYRSMMSVQSSLVMVPINEFGSEALKQKYLPKLATGQWVGCFGLTEPDHGSDPAGMITRAERDGEDWILNGRKIWITRGAEADFTITMAVTDREKGARGGISAFLIDRGTPGFNVLRRIPMLGGQYSYEIALEDCRVPGWKLLGKEGQGFAPMQVRLSTRRIEMASWSIGMAQRALDMLIEYAPQRSTFGAPLSERQQIQWWIADAATRIHAARLMTYDCAWKLDQGRDVRNEISMIKAYGTEMAYEVVDNVMQAFGAMGMTRELPLHLMQSKLRTMRIYDGPTEVHKWVVARNLLGLKR
jgi:acyl-CoA dehydrogenase